MEKSRGSSYFWYTLFGALFGGALVTWLAPKVIAWYFKPPAQVEFSCEAPIQWALQRLQWAQLGGLLGGALAGLILRFSFRNKVETPTAAPPSATLLK